MVMVMVQWFRKTNSERPDSFVFYANYGFWVPPGPCRLPASPPPPIFEWPLSLYLNFFDESMMIREWQIAMGFNCKLPSTKLVFDVPTDLNDVLIQTKGLSLSPWWLCHRFLLRGRTCRLGRGSLALRFLTKVSTLVFTKFILRFSIIIRTNFLNYHQN